jgi:hypothetical protein
MSVAPQSNVDRLKAANVLPANHTLSEADVDKVNKLSPPEVDTLIKVHAQLGNDFVKRNSSMIL